MNKQVLLISVLFVLVIFSNIVNAYDVGPNEEVHQHITNESAIVWKLTPNEIKEYLGDSLQDYNDDNEFDSQDTIITGSAEEDYGSNPLRHFWQPDDPQIGEYDNGLFLFYSSSYTRARGYWKNYVIPAYNSGDKDEAYYWLGRIAHLLEDAAQPSHVHLDPHPIFSILENHTGKNFNTLRNTYNWQGTNFAGQQYNYEHLINNFNWDDVKSDYAVLNDPGQEELFKLFWYTAQKTQYWASDDKNGNTFYTLLNGSTPNWDCSGTGDLNLWKDDGYTSCSDFINNSADLNSNNVEQEANATIPHAMKAVSGLYRLFWDSIKTDWPMFHHDLRRTGFTLLKGDFNEKNIQKVSTTIDVNIDKSRFHYPSVADVDLKSNNQQEIILPASRFGFQSQLSTLFYVLDYDKKTKSMSRKWWIDIGNNLVTGAPSIADLRNDKQKYVVFATNPSGGGEGKVYAFKGNLKNKRETNDARWSYSLPTETEQGGFAGDLRHTTVEDIDLDGLKEVIVADTGEITNWQSFVYVLEPQSSRAFNLQKKFGVGNSGQTGGPLGAISVANIDTSDDELEIVIPDTFGIYVYSYDNNQFTKIWNNTHTQIISSAIISDVDADNEYELVYATRDSDSFCSQVTCTRKLYIVNALTGAEEASIALSEYPVSDAVVGNLDNDKELEIAIITSNAIPATYGRLRIFDLTGGLSQTASFPSSSSDMIMREKTAPDIFDIDNDGTNDIVFMSNNGTFYAVNNNGALKFSNYLGGNSSSTPAIGDIDGDGTAEIATKNIVFGGAAALADQKTIITSLDGGNITKLSSTEDDVLSIVGSDNSQPELEFIENVYVIENNFVNITPIATDQDNNPLTFFFSSPLNSSQDNLSGEWQTDENSSGTYEVLIETSDNNLTDSQFVALTIFEEGTNLTSVFDDQTSEKSLEYTQAENKTVNIELPKNASISRAAVDLLGLRNTQENNSFQEPEPVIIEANELNLSQATNLSIDKDFSTYYSAGKATGAIVEIANLTTLANAKHIIVHIKLGIFGGGTGRFAVYNYNNNTYEIISSSLEPFAEDSKDFYFDIYETNPLWTDNDTALSYRVNNLNDYINDSSIRWYYRYLGDFASQRIYESEIKFEQDIIFPSSISLDMGNNGIDKSLDGELINNVVKIDSFNNSNNNETIILIDNTTTIRYISIPKDAELTKADLRIGEKQVETLTIEQRRRLAQSRLMEEKETIRGENFVSLNNYDGTRTATFYTEPINYFNGQEFMPIDKTIVNSSNLEYDYEVTKGLYQAYFKQDPTKVNTIKVEKDNEYITLQPISLSYNNILGEKQIANANPVMGIAQDNEFIYKNIFGNGIDLKYEYENTRLKESIVINEFNNLVLPTLNKNNLSLDIKFLINKNSNFTFIEPYLNDANNKIQKLSYELSNNYIIIKVPYSILENVIYPIIIDPSVEFTPSQQCRIEESPGDVICADLGNPEHQSYNSGEKDIRFFLKFDVTSIQTDEATHAILTMNCNGVTNAQSGVSDTVIYNISDSWTPSSFTWDSNQPSHIDPSLGSWFCTSGTQGPFDLNVTNNTIDDISTGFLSYKGISKTEGSSTRRTVSYDTLSHVNITYTLNSAPLLAGCSDDSTEKDSDGSDISIDLWDCHFDENDLPQDSTFSILSETNTALIDCSINNNQHVTCGAPATNSIGFSDVVVQVSDGALTDNDTIRISVKESGNVTLSINNTEVYLNNFWKYDDLDILNDVQNYLDICEEDSSGNCQVPIEITSDNNLDFQVDSIDVNYILRELDFTSELNNYMGNCATDTCNISLTFESSTEGTLNLSDLQIFYTIAQPKVFAIQDSSGNNVASFADNGNIILKGICSVNANCNEPSDSFIIKDSLDNTVSYIDSNGNLCLESGTCDDNYPNCNAPGDGSFIIRNENDVNVAYINSTGALCLTGGLIQSGTP
ncbi:VCBS repeat-containing protein [Candidatus Woesearchaeota archaeon]|nr:VCBS repeat-containing protein [Candidatus Woesearchaeota archaeon]